MRKLVIGSMVFVCAILGWDNMSFGEQPPAPRGELRIVDKNPTNWAWITFNVFDHLVEIDKDGTFVPGLATHWQWLDDHTLEVNLRQGVTFHNGEIFDADMVKLNWDGQTQLGREFPATTAPRHWGVYELHTRVAIGDHRFEDRPIRVSHT